MNVSASPANCFTRASGAIYKVQFMLIQHLPVYHRSFLRGGRLVLHVGEGVFLRLESLSELADQESGGGDGAGVPDRVVPEDQIVVITPDHDADIRSVPSCLGPVVKNLIALENIPMSA